MTITEPGIYFTRDGRVVTVLATRGIHAVGRYLDEFHGEHRYGLWAMSSGQFLGLVNGAENPVSMDAFDIVEKA